MREFMFKHTSSIDVPVCLTFLFFLLLIGGAPVAVAATATEIDTRIDVAIEKFYMDVSEGKALAKKASGILVLPNVVKAGLVVGGEYGEGALRSHGKTLEYYATAAASFGLQVGAQSKTIILLFITKESLSAFRASEGWEIGVDGAVAWMTDGVAGALDSNTLKDPIIGFVFNNKGLILDVSLEGTKFTKIVR